jgi:hypothetical protein
MIEILAIIRAISPLPWLPHKRVEKTTSAKFNRRMPDFVMIVNNVFFDSILSAWK